MATFLRRRPGLARLMLLSVAALLAFLVGELALRIAGTHYPNFYQPDPVLGWALRPGAQGRWVREGGGWVEINHQGWRERELPVAMAPGTFRIAVLGDSMTEALQVDAEATFPRLLEERLATCPHLPPGMQRMEVLNFGVSGYGTAQQLLTLRHAVKPYEPDLVLLAFFPGNDVRNNSRALQKEGRRPYFLLTENGDLDLDDRFRKTRGYRFRSSLPGRAVYAFLDHSRLAQALKELWAVASIDARRQRRGVGGAEWGLDPEVYRAPTGGAWEDAWQVTEALILAAREESRGQGARFALTSLTDGLSVHPAPEKRIEAAQALHLSDLGYPGVRLQRLADAQDLPYLDLRLPLARRAAETDTFYHGFPNTRPGAGHWNEAGHASASEVLAAWLCRALTAPTPRQTPPVSHQGPARLEAPEASGATAPGPPDPR